MKKLSNAGAWLKKDVAYEKSVYCKKQPLKQLFFKKNMQNLGQSI